jgi:RNA polymerase sigma-70 factor (ECF subfamily)
MSLRTDGKTPDLPKINPKNDLWIAPWRFCEGSTAGRNSSPCPLFEKIRKKPVRIAGGLLGSLVGGTRMNAAAFPEPSSQWLRRARQGDRAAVDRILDIYRGQLKKVVVSRFDPRLAGRFDASDVVQDVLATASDSMSSWIRDDKPLYACLYQLVRDRLALLRRNHIEVQKRSVAREALSLDGLSDASIHALCQRLGGRQETPSKAAIRDEIRDKVRFALGQLREADREILVMRILEGVPAREVGLILDISEAAVNMRQLRALKHIRSLLHD